MAHTPDTNSSVDIISTPSWSATDSEDDEVVWGISGESSSESSLSDYVLLPRTGTVRHVASTYNSDSDDSTSETGLSLPFDLLSITTSSKADDESHTKQAQQKLSPGKRKAKGASSIEDPSSTPRSNSGAATPTSSYEDASAFITRHLNSPTKEGRTSAGLQLLQAFIVELGASQHVPTSLTSARKLLKAEAHINIQEYVAVRGKDQGALREILHPSKRALRNNIRKTGKKKSLKWVKEHGLEVFLIGCYN
ncbi:hypothetical protein AZE42_06374 [Rhizopogon vesiculosus]|uniref:Uncharacterized protein n=1 Tax=Rhizopogon vesiculosus TaxID=180088 RepID=A0A1J8PW16_9AGAM|nr:hypothetical protein AZE42_06374 [Rhizopogon vesiculosus]